MAYMGLMICTLLCLLPLPSDADLRYGGAKEVQQKQNISVILPGGTAAGSYSINFTGLQQLTNQTLDKYVQYKRKSKYTCMNSLCIVFFTIYLTYLAYILL